MGFQVTVQNTGAVIDCPPDRPILHAAITAGIDFPYGCASGNCGACITEIRSGEVSLLPHSDTSLTSAQRAEGKTLACRARPRSDVILVWLGRGRR